MKVEEADLRELRDDAAEAMSKYKFRRRVADQALARHRSGRELEKLVDGRWIRFVRPLSFYDPHVWESVEDADALAVHTVDYLTPELDAAGLRWSGGFRQRLRRSAAGRWLVPALAGGATRSLDERYSIRIRQLFRKILSRAGEDELERLKDQAQSGYEVQRERNATIEQRANFFLGAAGLSSTLVLANGSILLGAGEGALHSPWRELSAAAFAFASVCSILAGIRALQAVMLTFTRISPNGVAVILDPESSPGAVGAVCTYVSALLVAQEREVRVGEWKLARLSEARRWFGGAVLGVVVVTGFVLVEVL